MHIHICTLLTTHVPGGRSGRRSPRHLPQGPNSHPRQRCRSRCWTSVAEGRWPYACHARHAPPSHAHHRPPPALPPRPQPPRPAAAPQHRFAADATLSTTALLQPSSARRLTLLPPRATPPLASLPAPGGRWPLSGEHGRKGQQAAEESGGGGGAHIISLLAGVLPSRLAALFLPPAAR